MAAFQPSLSSETGMISVSRGASLDPDLTQPATTSYFLEVALLLAINIQLS